VGGGGGGWGERRLVEREGTLVRETVESLLDALRRPLEDLGEVLRAGRVALVLHGVPVPRLVRVWVRVWVGVWVWVRVWVRVRVPWLGLGVGLPG
jgi:hypothetical protein